MARRKIPFYRVLLKDKYGTYFHYITQAQTAERARQKALHHWIAVDNPRNLRVAMAGRPEYNFCGTTDCFIPLGFGDD